MPDAIIETHQLAGFDNRERGFSRPVECQRNADGFQAVLRYESMRMTAEHAASAQEAVQALVHRLHHQGYRDLRSQMSFKNGTYLGSQEPWIQYPDPETEGSVALRPWIALWRRIQRAVVGERPGP
jgi:hypothetical protein